MTEQNVPSYTYAEPVAVGTVLPSSGFVYHKLPAEYGSGDYEYTVVNKRTVVVEPGTRRVVQIVN